MTLSFRNRASFQAAEEFRQVADEPADIFRRVLPASAWRLDAASHQIIHLLIHSDRGLNKAPGQWRIGRCLAAAESARRALLRMRRNEEHRVVVGAALEVLERLVHALQAEKL